MKGKRLYQLIKELNRTEHRQLLHACSISSDKRNAALLLLLKKRNLSEKTFEAWLLTLVASWNIKNEAEQDKKQRRWVDFACKEIENLLLRNHYNESEKRSHDLSQIFNKRNHQDLTSYYNSKAIERARKNKWYDVLIQEYDLSIRWLSRNQTSKNISLIASLMRMRRRVTDLRYHEATSYFYTVNSSLFLDLPSRFSDTYIVPDSTEFKQLLKSSPDNFSLILYSLAEVRYSFYKKQKFELLLEKCFSLIACSELKKSERDVLKRSALYLKITGGLYYGYPIKTMTRDAREMFEYSVRYELRDTTGFFLLLFFLLIECDMVAYDDYLKKYRASMFIKGNEDYTGFLQAFKYFQEGNYRDAVNILIDVSYSQSHYLAIWSRLLEIAIHRKDGELGLCKVMISRAKRMVLSDDFPKILNRPVLNYLQVIEQTLKGKQQADSSQWFTFYRSLI